MRSGYMPRFNPPARVWACRKCRLVDLGQEKCPRCGWYAKLVKVFNLPGFADDSISSRLPGVPL